MAMSRAGIRRRPESTLGQFFAPRVCKVCKGGFTGGMMLAKVCSLPCAQALAVSIRGKAEKVAAVKERKADKVKRQDQKSHGKLIAEAQTAFNAWTRARDTGKPCICCGKHGAEQVHGGTWDAGHYRSRGSAPHLRFDERNVHAQLKQCNRYDSGNVVGYRLGLINRLGLEVVEALEADQTPRKYTRDELVTIKRDYSAKTKELKVNA